MAPTWILILLFASFFRQGDCAIKLDPYFTDHMVLQRGPKQAILWGTADTEGGTVNAEVIGQGSHGTQVNTKVAQGGRWKVALPAQTAKGPFAIHISSGDSDIRLLDVLFGDVWLCSGQSNMYFTLNHVINATAELQHALQFPDIRFTRVRRRPSAIPLLDSANFDIPWTGPNSTALSSSSAVCWLFAEYLMSKVNYPIGLIESSYGGTPIEAWSPPEALNACTHRTKRGPKDPSALWNAMISPILSTTLYGALWYQGEANAGHSAAYACQIEYMVKEWRRQFHQNSEGQTSKSFPFGYVQIAGSGHGDYVGSFPGERWAQTANYGYSPNPALPNTFMAVAMDLPDVNSPQGSIHPRFKQDVAERLVLGALNVAYGQSSVTFQGPFPTGLMKNLEAQHTLAIRYDNGTSQLTVKNTRGFEVCCSVHNTTHCDAKHDRWVAAPITDHHGSQVTVNTASCGQSHVVGVRYEWRQNPCDYKQCSVYDSVSGLPAPAYISYDLTANTGAVIG